MKLLRLIDRGDYKEFWLFGKKFDIGRDTKPKYMTQEDVLKLLNYTNDIRNCPKARGKLRKLQIADTLLLQIFHIICKRNDIPYFLSDGTLLGAIRHDDFIPWDDDLDIGIIYDSYDKLVSVFKKAFEGTNFEIWGVDKTRLGNATFRISHKNFPSLNLDVFYSHCSGLEYSEVPKVREIWEEYRVRYYERYAQVHQDENAQTLKAFREEFDIPFEKEIKVTDIEHANMFIYQISSFFRAFKKEWIFPIKTHKFGDFEFCVPNDSHKALEEMFGDYMLFPPALDWHGGFFTHFEEETIEPVIQELKEYLERLENE